MRAARGTSMVIAGSTFIALMVLQNDRRAAPRQRRAVGGARARRAGLTFEGGPGTAAGDVQTQSLHDARRPSAAAQSRRTRCAPYRVHGAADTLSA